MGSWVLNRTGTLEPTFENTDAPLRGTGVGTENNDRNDRDFSVEYSRHHGAAWQPFNTIL